MKTFGDRVKEFNGRLTESDRTLVAWVLNNPEEAVYISSAELANKAEVHASTVVRLAHKIGYEGFPAMRNHIRERMSNPDPHLFLPSSENSIRSKPALI